MKMEDDGSKNQFLIYNCKFQISQANQISFYNVIDFLSIISWKLSSFLRFLGNWRFFDSENFENIKTETIGY